MLTTIAKLFGKSPFSPLQTHMKKVSVCIKKLSRIFDVTAEKDLEKVEELVKELSKLEHEADLTKNDIRNHLPKSLFLPIDRSQLLDMLSIQDSIADKAEEVGNFLILHPLKTKSALYDGLKTLYLKNAEAFWDVYKIIQEMDELLESTFGGREAERVKELIEQTSYKEHEADLMKQALRKQAFECSDELSGPSFYLYMRLIDEINEISHISEKLANRIRMILELK